MKQDILSHVLDTRDVSELGPGPEDVPTADQVYAEHDRLGALAALLPELRLPLKERRSLGAYLFQLGPSLVLAVAHALIGSPDVFPQGVAIGTSLKQRLTRSMALRCLELILITLARRAGEMA